MFYASRYLFDLLFTWSECKFVYSIFHLHFHSREDGQFSNKDIVIELFIIHQRRFYRVEEETLILNLIYEIEYREVVVCEISRAVCL